MDQKKYQIEVQFDGFIARQELNHILTSIDRVIERTLFPEIRRNIYPSTSYLGITGVSSGSIILEFITGSAVAIYIARRFKKGFDTGLASQEIERAGRIVSDAFGSLLVKINDWAEKHVAQLQSKGSHIKSITLSEKKTPDESDKLS